MALDPTKQDQHEHAITEVTSIISHQLKTPLAGIKSSLEVILSGDLGPLSKDQKEYLELTLIGTEKMIGLVRELLDASRIDEGRFELHPVPTDIVAIVRGVVDDLTMFGQAKNTTISFHSVGVVPPLNIDPTKIREVVSNIIYNAIRYSRGKGTINVSLEKKGSDVEFSCQDHGIGIVPEHQKKVFTKFYRSPEALALATEGSGLGLYIAKAIIEASGGAIWFRSTIGVGSIFYFTLPIQ